MVIIVKLLYLIQVCNYKYNILLAYNTFYHKVYV